MPNITSITQALDFDLTPHQGDALTVKSPVDGQVIATLALDNAEALEKKITAAQKAFHTWRQVPAPKRGELVRRFGEVLRANKQALGELVTLEAGKILSEGLGEVQEMIDICDYAVGLSRMLGGRTLPSERAGHSLNEYWQPLGTIGVISAFNFPVAVWAWNTAIALVCGDSVVWKPSEKTPLTALACLHLFGRAAEQCRDETGIAAPDGLCSLILGEAGLGAELAADARLPLISATGSCRMGRAVYAEVAATPGRRALLELGGNNAAIITPSADLKVALPSVVFGAVGTAGQRCTTTRRLFVHHERYGEVVEALENAYGQLVKNRIGNPLQAETLIGPLIDEHAFEAMQAALEAVWQENGKVHFGKRALEDAYPDATYVQPALVELDAPKPITLQETFAPILYVMPYYTLDKAVEWINQAPQGLSSAIFTTDLREAEYFKANSVNGIVNVNCGTSGAEIGGAFGGEKETGGGRESGSDSWKAYMRRVTSTTYHGSKAPELAQGVKFAV